MNNKNKLLAKLERRRPMGRIAPDRDNTNYNRTKDLGDFEKSFHNDGKLVVFREEKLPGSVTPKIASFTQRPFDDLNQALEAAEAYIRTVLARLSEVDKTRSYSILKKDNAPFEGNIAFLLIGNDATKEETSKISRDSYVLQVYVKKTSYYQNIKDSEGLVPGEILTIRQLRFNATGSVYDDYQKEVKTFKEAEKVVNQLFSDAKSSYRLDLGDFSYIETKLAVDQRYDKLVKMIVDNKTKRPVAIVAPVGVKTTNAVPRIEKLNNK